LSMIGAARELSSGGTAFVHLTGRLRALRMPRKR